MRFFKRVVSSSCHRREELIKSHYSTKLNQLTLQIQFADSQAVTFRDECRALALRLELALQARAKLGEELQGANAKLVKLGEEMESTKRNYENQLAMMTEHVMSMNDKLSARQDQINDLKQRSGSVSRGSPRSGRAKPRK
eukprot:m.65403 g.65403  ORF g.65403 m.65403 type:complete len:140 (-) comp7572_c0_seq2:2115-2534(-)